jgi:serine protease Do
VVRGYLGVALAPVSPEVARAAGLPTRRGALVAEVVERSPAAAADLKPGDLITAFQGAEVQNPYELTRRVAGTPPGTRVSLSVASRAGARSVTVTLGELPGRGPGGDR